MRRWLVLGCLLLVGCAGPHTTGGLWAEQNLQNELARFRLTDAQRAAAVQQFQFGVADDLLDGEQARLDGLQAACPNAGAASLEPSVGDRVRDAVRVQAAGDAARKARVARLALADWWLRRAAVSGEDRFCELARAALAGQVQPMPAAAADPLAGLGSATVARDPSGAGVLLADQQPSVALSLYALGWADTVQAASPLPQYLAAVYGGNLTTTTPSPPTLGDRSPEQVVDELAPAHPEWEPDALYAALRPR